MSKMFMVLALLLLATPALANPFLVCDPPTTGSSPTWYELDGLPWLTGHYAAETDLSMKVDLVDTPAGQPYIVKVRACNVWGCSDWSDTLNFTRPAGGCSAPSALRIRE